MGDLTLREQIQALGLSQKITEWVRERLPIRLTSPPHPYKPGDVIWWKEWNVQLLKPHWKGPFVVLSTLTAVKVAEISRDCSLDPPQLSETRFSRVGMHPWPSPTMKDHPLECPCPSLVGPCFPGDNKRPQMPALLLSPWKLTSLCTLEVWGVTHLTLEDESLLCFLLANLGHLSTWGPPCLGLWLMYVYYPSGKCCYQNPGFPYLLFLHSHSCLIMHPQPYHLLRVLSLWSVHLF
jgi:hypothetical protein